MNIFILDTDPLVAAEYHCDKHVVKMIVESAQMLSTAHRVRDGELVIGRTKTGRRQKQWRLSDSREGVLYKAAYVNHPCTVWTGESLANYTWHYHLFYGLCHEYSRRYGKTHSTWEKLGDILAMTPLNVSDDDMTPFPLCMPDEYKIVADPVRSYRDFYVAEKTFARWDKIPDLKPDWYHDDASS